MEGGRTGGIQTTTIYTACTKPLGQVSGHKDWSSLISSVQREIVSEELDHVSEQHQQLSSVFAAQSAELARVEAEGKKMREKLALREAELARVHQKKERRASVSKVHVYTNFADSACCLSALGS